MSKAAVAVLLALALAGCGGNREAAAIPDGQLEALNTGQWRPTSADYDRARSIIRSIKR